MQGPTGLVQRTACIAPGIIDTCSTGCAAAHFDQQGLLDLVANRNICQRPGGRKNKAQFQLVIAHELPEGLQF